MTGTGKTFCDTHYRHLRLLFLVDTGVSEKFLVDLFMGNYQKWGGRYNPVIPVNSGQLTPFYRTILNEFDPDIIYYSEGVGLENARRICKSLHAKDLIQLDPDGRNNFPGIYAHHLLPIAHRQASQYFRNFTLVYFQRHQEDPQTSFYNLSFGIQNQYVEDINLGQGYHTTILDITNLAETNQYIGQQCPFFNCLLSEQQPEFYFLNPTNDWEFNCLEFIIYEDNQHFDDLIYFWNRALSQRPRGEILQLVASRSQLDLLTADVDFGRLLRAVARDNTIYLHSLSVHSDQLEEIRSMLQRTFPGVSYRIADYHTIPRIRQVEYFPHSRELRLNKNLMLGKKDHVKLPSPVWNSDSPTIRGTYVYDAAFYVEDDYGANYLKFPYRTVAQFVIGRHEVRVNKKHHISFFLDQEKQSLDIQIPTATAIFDTRIQSFSRFGSLEHSPVRNLTISDAGLKLTSFVNLFDGRLGAAADILTERFWVDLILGQSTGSKKKQFEFKRLKEVDGATVEEQFFINTPASNIYNTDGTFNHLDLEAERRLIYLEHAAGIRQWLASEGLTYNDDELIEFLNISGSEDFEHHIDPYLQYLTNRDALYIGMKVKCRHCGSNSWYSLGELKNKMNCKGCLQVIIPAIESRLSYRFNDIVYNNFSSDPVKREKTFHGNYVVLRTLSFFADHHGAYSSFQWSPSLDIGVKKGSGFIGTDIDIAMLIHGKLIIGEAKASASDFNAAQFEQLRLIMEAIQPDQLILAYLNGVINEERLEGLKKLASNFGCEVITHRVELPQYIIGRIR